MTYDELEKHEKATLLQLLLSADARRDALTAQLESTLKDRKLILEERDRTFALMLARAEAAEADAARLREALKPILRFVPQSIVECRGDKCREPWCASCYGEDAAITALDRASAEAAAARAALKGETP